MLNLVPTPKYFEMKDEEYHRISMSLYSHNLSWEKYIPGFDEMISKAYEVKTDKNKGGIELICDTDMCPGSYAIYADENVRLVASDDEGILYAMASVLQLINVNNGEAMIQKFEITDYPEKSYRAVMVDLGRQWHPFDKLLKYVDMCFLYKIKYLHLHFMDDQLYTLPSKVYPKLSSDGKHYSFEEIAYLNSYAKLKGIIVIPEYECPGHASRIVKTYPEIFANKIDDSYVCELKSEVGAEISKQSLVCAGNEKCFEATCEILKEICDMFPDAPYINIGGDEANIKLWNACVHCREYMTKKGIKDEYELYSDYIARVTKYILSIGKIPIVWEGFPKKGAEKIPKETIVVAWESHYHMAYDLLAEGFRIINSSWVPLYIVPYVGLRWGVKEILDWNVYNWQHWWEESEATLNPINVESSDNVLGAMMCVWELTFEREIGLAMENLSALSERVWSVKRSVTYDDFVKMQLKLLHITARIIQDR